MSIESILGIDNSDPESRHADYLVEADLRLMKDLVAFRKKRNIAQATVAERMGIDPSGVSKIEAGHRDLLQSTIQRYALAIGAVIDHKIRAFEEIDAGTPQSEHAN
ncbi:helix-turn-helix domain-containing protein [Enteractinococcus helveticum]|uniref:HTH cro/C1-type domain-containing protein n=1 Tax=Enteractinococcus helveticum TaxID=1837282 RepID=A0A1B7M0L7_9MICC|nr:helix-turn-helix transcriptional regulator [Enteractinococcus helveticum]OAV61798.1 hypothetical protein A6F49_07845 [Enteractinococcus helveticum]